MRSFKLLACVCLVAGGLAVAAGGAAAKPRAKHHAVQSPSANCNAHNYKLTRHYSVSALQKALATMPAQIKEYTPCYQVVQNQLNSQLSQQGTTPGGVTPKSSGSSLSGVLIAVIVVIVLAGGGMAYWASRRSSGGGDGDDTPPTAGS